MSTKFEQLLDLIVNEEMDKANELFHEIVVEKSRDIYENLIAEEAEEARTLGRDPEALEREAQALRLEDFEKIMEEAGIYLLDIFGDYKLRKFYKTQSERLIMIFK